MSILTKRGVHWLQTQGRLNPGVDKRTAAADLTAISAQIAHEFNQLGQVQPRRSGPIWKDGGGSVSGPGHDVANGGGRRCVADRLR